MPPSSPGYVQSPISYGTPTPPGGVAAGQFLPQPSQSPTKQTPPTSAPTSQPQMGPSVSPQNAGNPMQKPQTTAPSEQPPMSPESQKRENRKIDLLLEINRFLFQEIVLLQAAGRGQPAQNRGSESNAQGGQQSPTGTENGKDVTAEAKDSGTADSETKPDEKEKKTVASREYIEYVALHSLGLPILRLPHRTLALSHPSLTLRADVCAASKQTSPTSRTSSRGPRNRRRRSSSDRP